MPQKFNMSFIIGFSDSRIEGMMGFTRSITADKFKFFSSEMLKKVKNRSNFGGKRIVLIMDNCSIHKAKLIQDYLEKERILYLTIVAYSPFLNPCEHLIQSIKSKVKRDHDSSRVISLRRIQRIVEELGRDSFNGFIRASRSETRRRIAFLFQSQEQDWRKMEKEYIDPRKLANKFRSKSDLYKRMVIDMNYFLPPYKRCPVKFMKQLLSGDKKAYKMHKIVHLETPEYRELSLKNLWPKFKDDEDLMVYIPDMPEGQMPDREFFFAILSTLYNEETMNLINKARRNRTLEEEKDQDELVEIHPDMKKEIDALLNFKTSKGRTNFLLKKKSNLKRKRKDIKEYEADLSLFRRRKNPFRRNERTEEIRKHFKAPPEELKKDHPMEPE